jgi:glycosyltransferase involved in cell wall biosynthesis
MVVKNEEGSLPRCLDSVRGLAGDIILADTGSTDATVRVAQRYGARVLPFDFTTIDFAAARNHALAQAAGRWILVLDADETLHPESRARIESQVAETPKNTGYYFERHNHGRKTTRDYVVRLFPNRPDYRYHGRVHETIDASILGSGGRLVQTNIRIDHDYAPDALARRAKSLLYVAILHEEIAAHPSDLTRLDFLAAEYHQLEMFEEAARVTESIAALRPLDARAQLFAGLYHLLYKPDFTRAQEDFRRALQLRPDYPEAREFLELLESRES